MNKNFLNWGPTYNNLAKQTVECLTFFSFKKSLHPIEHLPSKNFLYFLRKVFLMWHCNMVGNSLIIFLSKTLIFYAKMSEWAIPSTKWVICSFLVSDMSKSLMIAHFWEQPERFAHSRYFVMSDLSMSNSLTSLFQKEGMSESLVFFITIFLSTKFFWLYSNFFEWIGGIAHFLWGKERPERISEFQSDFGFPWKLPLSSTARWRSTTWMLLPWPQSFLSLWTVSHWWRSRSRNQIIQKVCFLLVITVGKLSSVSFGYCSVCTVNKM